MPGGVVTDQHIARLLTLNIGIGVIQKGLKDHRIAMGEFQSIDLTGSRIAHTRDIHPDMITITCDPPFFSFLDPSSAGSWVPFHTGLIQESQLDLIIGKQLF